MLDAIYWALITLKSGLYQLPSTLKKLSLSNNFRASNTFCQMACGILNSIGDFIRIGSDEIVKNMYDVPDDIDEEENTSR